MDLSVSWAWIWQQEMGGKKYFPLHTEQKWVTRGSHRKSQHPKEKSPFFLTLSQISKLNSTCYFGALQVRWPGDLSLPTIHSFRAASQRKFSGFCFVPAFWSYTWKNACLAFIRDMGYSLPSHSLPSFVLPWKSIISKAWMPQARPPVAASVTPRIPPLSIAPLLSPSLTPKHVVLTSSLLKRRVPSQISWSFLWQQTSSHTEVKKRHWVEGYKAAPNCPYPHFPFHPSGFQESPLSQTHAIRQGAGRQHNKPRPCNKGFSSVVNSKEIDILVSA